MRPADHPVWHALDRYGIGDLDDVRARVGEAALLDGVARGWFEVHGTDVFLTYMGLDAQKCWGHPCQARQLRTHRQLRVQGRSPFAFLVRCKGRARN